MTLNTPRVDVDFDDEITAVYLISRFIDDTLAQLATEDDPDAEASAEEPSTAPFKIRFVR